jgi:ribosomal protein S27E
MKGDRKNKIFSSLAECPEEYSGTLSNRFVDIKGNIYNNLEVLYLVRFKNGRAEWLCKCLNCGNYVIVNSHNLRSGHTKSCGCLVSEKLRKDIVGQIFGKLKVIKYDKSENEHPYWIVECLNCGKIYSVSGNSLKNIESCGCLKHSKREHIIKEELEEWAKSIGRDFETEKTFEDCIFRSKLRFDFYLGECHTNFFSIKMFR